MENKKINAVLNYIEDEIQKGNLKNGSKLPPERALTEILDVSRSTVREGIKILQTLGLIKNVTGGGNYIVENFKNMLCSPFSLAFKLQGGNESDIIEFRRSLELSNAESVLKKVTDKDIEELEDIHEKMLACVDLDELVEIDLDFHSKIISFSRNTVLIMTLNAVMSILKESMHESRKNYSKKYGSKNIEKDHKNILESIKRNDKELLIKEISEHFNKIFDSSL